jgi:hypothetical protein
MGKMGQLMAGTALGVGLGVASAGEAPTASGSIEYQATSSQEMTQVLEEGGKRSRQRIVIINRTTNTNTACASNDLVICAGHDINITPAPPPPNGCTTC